MGWTDAGHGRETLVEWERSDGRATVRLRQRGDGAWVVRLDRLTQAPEGPLYREKRLDDREAADAVAERWRRLYDVVDGGEGTERDLRRTTGDGADGRVRRRE
jgi:hypothetical protein